MSRYISAITRAEQPAQADRYPLEIVAIGANVGGLVEESAEGEPVLSARLAEALTEMDGKDHTVRRVSEPADTYPELKGLPTQQVYDVEPPVMVPHEDAMRGLGQLMVNASITPGEDAVNFNTIGPGEVYIRG